MAVIVRELEPHEWQLLRDLRLAALQEAPTAFGSTYAAERELTEPQWADRARLWTAPGRSAAFVALAGSMGVGIVSVTVDPAADGRPARVYSMWVAPSARGHGVGRALMTQVIDWATRMQAAAIYLNVTSTNTAATNLYRALAFTPTGTREPHRAFPELEMLEMSKSLRV